MWWVAAACLVVIGCGGSAHQAAKRTLPEPLVAAKLPERPDARPIPAVGDWVIPIEAGETVERAGICMSTEKATRAARYVVSYDELRRLYTIDLGTWGRERAIYERHLGAADQEIERARKEAERSWFELHSGSIGMAAGFVVGAAITVGIVAGVEQVK